MVDNLKFPSYTFFLVTEFENAINNRNHTLSVINKIKNVQCISSEAGGRAYEVPVCLSDIKSSPHLSPQLKRFFEAMEPLPEDEMKWKYETPKVKLLADKYESVVWMGREAVSLGPLAIMVTSQTVEHFNGRRVQTTVLPEDPRLVKGEAFEIIQFVAAHLGFTTYQNISVTNITNQILNLTNSLLKSNRGK